MKSMIYNVMGKYRFIGLLFVTLFIVSCSTDDEQYNNGQGNETYVTLLAKAASANINEDKVLWEDRVSEIRMIAFDSQTGEAVYNSKLSFPNGFSSTSDAIRFKAGNYNFYFIANESAYSSGFLAALTSISAESDFSTDARFSNLQYNPNFVPKETGDGALFLMSAQYSDIQVADGGTKDSPLPLGLPNGRVELVRALAKIEVIFRKKVSGSSITPNSIASIQLGNVASLYSVPTQDDYYAGTEAQSYMVIPSGFNYANDSVGAVTFYIPELLRQDGSAEFTGLHINDTVFAVKTDDQKVGLTEQRRSISSLSTNSIIRNYHYIINAYIKEPGDEVEKGIIEIQTLVTPWKKDTYKYVFYGDKDIVIPPITPTDSSLIVTTDCGKVEIRYDNEILSQGLQGAYGDQVEWYNPATGGPDIIKGKAPYYCEKKYGPGWRLINSCELMSFLALFDKTYKIWESNTWEGRNHNLPFFPLQFRQQAQSLLEKLSGIDLSNFVLTDDGVDPMGDEKLGVLDQYFTPGDIMLREIDYPGGWPYAALPNNSGLKWYPSQVSIQVHGYWYSDYIDLSNRDNWDKILYQEFERYDYSRTVSRCVRSVE
ncbi:MAG: hypothetical protein LBV43_08105 [Prevotella sp.]|jgi:hypothetical protein|nr:hypothetical protein [Prevotella sp.]